MSNVFIPWGSMLKDMRKAHHLKQEEVARILHISRPDYSHIERGKVRPSPEIISILSNLYDRDLFIYALEKMPEAMLREQSEFKSFLASGLSESENPLNKKESGETPDSDKII